MAASNKPYRSIKPPQRPLDDDFTWDTLGPLSSNFARMSSDLAQLAHFPSAVPFPTLPTNIHPANDLSISVEIPPSASPTNHSKHTDGATPILTHDACFVASNPQYQASMALNLPRDLELHCLLLTKESQQLEVQKLQLQLELAKLQASTGPVAPDGSSKVHDQTKSLGDLHAPQRTLFPQQWPHINYLLHVSLNDTMNYH